MEGLDHYLYSILATALICSVIQLFPLTGTAREITKLICGLVMTISVLSPLRSYDIHNLAESGFHLSSNAASITEEGERSARTAMSDIIKAESEAYIQNIADQLDVTVSCCIQVSDDSIPLPISATMTGQFSNQIRTQLEASLVNDLGIAKENITWIG